MSGERSRLPVVVTVGALVLATSAGVVALTRDTSTSSPDGDDVDDRAIASPSPSDAEEADGDAGDGGIGDLLDGLMGDGPSVTQLASCLTGIVPGSGAGSIPDDPSAAIDTIADQVATDRDLAFTEPVDPVLLDAEELSSRVAELVAEDYTPDVADQDRRLLAALGAIAPDTDLLALTTDLLGEQVAGFYDPETGELVSLADEEIDPAGAIILAHEIDHALTDQALGLPPLDEGTADEIVARQALVEGDASLLMQRWSLQHQTLAEQLGAASASTAGTDVLSSAPQYLQQNLVFPYTVGLGFVCELYAQGGWAAVDAAYTNLPTTTAQVLWPQRYLDREPAVDVPDPAVPEGFDLLRTDTIGAADLLWLFRAPGDDRGAALSDAHERAAAWAGGELVLSGRDDQTALGVVLADRGGTPTDLCASIVEWYAAAFPEATRQQVGDATERWVGPTQTAVVTCDGAEVHVGIGPDEDVARATLP